VLVLHYLGLLDLASADSQRSALRSSEAGVLLLRGTPLPPEPAVASNVVVQPSFQVFAFEPTPDDVLFTLDRIATRVRAERAVEYQVTRESYLRALQDGFTSTEVLAFLERVTTAPLPQNVRRSLEEWSAQQERIVVRRGVGLIHAADAATLDALYVDPHMGGLLGRRVSPTAALVAAAHLESLFDALLERGRQPALSEGQGDLPGGALTVDEMGRGRYATTCPTYTRFRRCGAWPTRRSPASLPSPPTACAGPQRRGLARKRLPRSSNNSTLALSPRAPRQWCNAGPGTGAAVRWGKPPCCAWKARTCWPVCWPTPT
jgi:hypothetical protein